MWEQDPDRPAGLRASEPGTQAQTRARPGNGSSWDEADVRACVGDCRAVETRRPRAAAWLLGTLGLARGCGFPPGGLSGWQSGVASTPVPRPRAPRRRRCLRWPSSGRLLVAGDRFPSRGRPECVTGRDLDPEGAGGRKPACGQRPAAVGVCPRSLYASVCMSSVLAPRGASRSPGP